MKSTRYLLAVGGLAIVILLLEKPWATKVGDVFEKRFFENLNTQEAARIEIEHLLYGVQLQKEGDQWRVAEFKTKLKGELGKTDNGQRTVDKRQEPQWFPADYKKVDLSLSGLQDLTIIALAGKNPEKHGYFEVNAVGMQVRLFDKEGKNMAHLYIGKTGPAFTESYVRKEGEKEVYIANRYLRSSFPPVVKDWEEKKETKK